MSTSKLIQGRVSSPTSFWRPSEEISWMICHISNGVLHMHILDLGMRCLCKTIYSDTVDSQKIFAACKLLREINGN